MSLTLFKESTIKAIQFSAKEDNSSYLSSFKQFFTGKETSIQKKEDHVILEYHPFLDEILKKLYDSILDMRKDKHCHSDVNLYDATDTKFHECITSDMTNVDYSEHMQEVPEERYKELKNDHIINMATMDLYALDIIFNTSYIGNHIQSNQYVFEDKYIQDKLFRVYIVGKHKFVQPKEVFSKFIDNRTIVEALKVLIYRKDFIKVVNSHTNKKINILCTKRGVLHILQFISKNHDIREPELQKWIQIVLELSKELVYKTSNV